MARAETIASTLAALTGQRRCRINAGPRSVLSRPFLAEERVISWLSSRDKMADPTPKVLGLGLSKTGTKSLRQALVSMGYSNHTWSPELLERWHGGDIAA